MNLTTLKRPARLFALVAAFVVSVALFLPTSALAGVISGTVTVTGVANPHTLNVTLHEQDSTGDWVPTAMTTTVNADRSYYFGAVPNGVPYKIVVDDNPYNWYQETVAPNVPTEMGYPSGGTPFTADSGTHDITVASLPESFSGTVRDRLTNAPLPQILVAAMVYQAGSGWVDVASTETAPDGTYQIHGLQAGFTGYRVEFTDYTGDHAQVVYSASQPVPPQALGVTLMAHVVGVERIAPIGSNYWSQSVTVTRRQFAEDQTKPYNATTNPANFEDVLDVVIASGDTRAQADPLAAAGLCWAYRVNPNSFNPDFNAPLLLVSATRKTDATVLALIREIATVNRTSRMRIRIVGGTGSVPDARFNEIAANLRSAGLQSPQKDRVVSKGDRYALAAGIATRMKAIRPAEFPGFVLVANGADPAKFFDPLALSPIAASNGAPILLVSATAVPAATTNVIKALRPRTIYVGGGAGTVSNAVLAKLKTRASGGSVRIWGKDRYLNAVAIANKAVAMGWLSKQGSIGLASTITNAQLAGVLAGNEASPILITQPTVLNSASRGWLAANKRSIDRVYVVGSTTAIRTSTVTALTSAVKN